MEKTKLKKPEPKAKKKVTEALSEALPYDEDCPIHGKLKTRGRVFKGKVVRKFPRRITIEFERMVYIKKYERYSKLKTKVHARLPKCMEKDIDIGSLVKIQECRPLSKIIHFVVIEKIKPQKQEKSK